LTVKPSPQTRTGNGVGRVPGMSTQKTTLGAEGKTAPGQTPRLATEVGEYRLEAQVERIVVNYPLDSQTKFEVKVIFEVKRGESVLFQHKGWFIEWLEVNRKVDAVVHKIVDNVTATFNEYAENFADVVEVLNKLEQKLGKPMEVEFE